MREKMSKSIFPEFVPESVQALIAVAVVFSVAYLISRFFFKRKEKKESNRRNNLISHLTSFV